MKVAVVILIVLAANADALLAGLMEKLNPVNWFAYDYNSITKPAPTTWNALYDDYVNNLQHYLEHHTASRVDPKTGHFIPRTGDYDLQASLLALHEIYLERVSKQMPLIKNHIREEIAKEWQKVRNGYQVVAINNNAVTLDRFAAEVAISLFDKIYNTLRQRIANSMINAVEIDKATNILRYCRYSNHIFQFLIWTSTSLTRDRKNRIDGLAKEWMAHPKVMQRMASTGIGRISKEALYQAAEMVILTKDYDKDHEVVTNYFKIPRTY